MWAAFVFHKKENEAPKTAAKKKAKAKQRQNKKDDDLIILDKDLLNLTGKKKNDDGEVANGKKKKGDDEVPQGKKKKRTDDEELPQGKKKRTYDEEVPQGKEVEEATSANDDKRKNAQLQVAKKQFRAFVQNNDVKPENYVSTLKKFFGKNQMMSSLWAELKRQRKKSRYDYSGSVD